MRREHLLKIKVNGRSFNAVIIDSHYEIKHSKTVNDSIILRLVKSLEGAEHRPESVLPSGFEIYVTEPVFLDDKAYRLIWTLHPDEDYIGIVNAFRRNHEKISK
jgi:hypothetical protein